MTLTALTVGFVIGAQHAFEPDHLAAMGTMVPGESSLKRATARGAWWGLGHGVAIAAVGIPLVLLGLRVPESLEAAAELVVAVMLVALGGRALFRAARSRTEETQEHHSHSAHSAPIGLIHGLAGSGAAVVLATTQSASWSAAVSFLVLFTLGSTVSMAATTGLISLPIRGFGAKTPWILGISGALSIAVGVVWGAPHLL